MAIQTTPKLYAELTIFLDNCILIQWSFETDQTVIKTFSKYFLVFHSDSSVSFQELSSDSFPHIFDVRKQILLRELIVSFSFLFCRFSTALRPKTQKMVLKVSVTFPHFGTEPIVAVKIPVKFFPFCLFFLAELTYPRLRVLLHFDTQEFLNVLSMVSKPVLS